ncbi:cytochrome P450 [Mollisia scopiformis]|uniref:Cytochrome P450 n=1 Tax=Mollisia scopiformis TaxID=149040 RepID=A0A194X408_MOLSC|nr:cytochrome P450 [Mollisia scopiformis]KUJ14784.1 cytochrome P450 [Mollisia scopiformis]
MGLYVLIGIPLLLMVVYGFLYTLESKATFPKNVPIVGYAQHGRPFVVYDPSAQQELLLPAQYVKWFAEQSDSKLNSLGVRQERHAVRYLHLGADVELASTTQFIRLISNDCLNQHLEALMGPLQDEMRRCIDAAFMNASSQNEWSTINVYSCIQDIVFPAMCRVFFGQSDMDPRLLKALQRYITVLGLSTIFVGELPHMLKGLLARLVRMPLAYYRNQTLRILIPLVESQLSRRDGSDESSFIRQCARLSEKNAVGGRGNAVAPQGFAGSSSTVIQATNLLLDIANCPPEMQVLQELRHEAEITLPDEELWHKVATFRKQVLADSVIRESLRMHPILIKGLTQEVVSPAGLQLPDGTNMPVGSWVGIPVLGIHKDEKFYPQADLYQPFRYVKKREAIPSRINSDDHSQSAPARAEVWDDESESTKPTTTYLGFGYGRHACPGRWFAVVMLKMITSHVSMNYDIESTGPVPQTMVLGDAALPPIWATIRVRRRIT